MSDQNGSPEANENEMEVFNEPNTGSIIPALPQDKNEIDNLIYLSQNIDRIVDAQNKIRMAMLRLAQPGDWVLFGDNKTGKAELGYAGAMRIASVMGVSFIDWSKPEKEVGKDDNGDFYRWNMECSATHGKRIVRAYGRAGSRDKFFGKSHGKYKPLHDIDEGNIKMSARRGAMKEGVKALFGLHHMNPAELAKFGIKLDSAGGYNFDKGQSKQSKEVSEEKAIDVHIDSITIKKGKKKDGKEWIKYIVTDAEGVKYNTFSKSTAEEMKKLAAEGTTVKLTYQTSDFGNDIVKYEVVENG